MQIGIFNSMRAHKYSRTITLSKDVSVQVPLNNLINGSDLSRKAKALCSIILENKNIF